MPQTFIYLISQQYFKLVLVNKKIRVVAVSYLNTKPLTYSLERGAMSEELELSFEYPSKLAEKLLNDEADIGLLPVAMIPSLKDPHIISDFCIATNGEVASVCLFSNVPLEEIKTIQLDYQSRTSVALLKVLLKYHWKINPELISSTPGYEDDFSGNTAALIIGDRALIKRIDSKYIYDLGTAWKEMTGLPFVFAAWVSNKKLSDSFLEKFNNSISESLLHINDIVASTPFPLYDLDVYYKKNIDYVLDDQKRKSMDLFLNYLE